jgi:hypothetical protein
MRLALRLALRREQVTRDPHVHISALTHVVRASRKASIAASGRQRRHRVLADGIGPRLDEIAAVDMNRR